jgi:hypothetical protein
MRSPRLGAASWRVEDAPVFLLPGGVREGNGSCAVAFTGPSRLAFALRPCQSAVRGLLIPSFNVQCNPQVTGIHLGLVLFVAMR